MHRGALAAATVLALLTLVAFSGCSSGGATYVKSKFRDADLRVAQAADGGFAQYWDLEVRPDVPALTIRASFIADKGLSFEVRGPNGRQTTKFSYPGATEVPEMGWIEATRPAVGKWKLGVECGRRCDFTFGFYMRDALPKDPLGPDAQRDATVRFTEDAQGASTRASKFSLPQNVSTLSMRVSLQTQDSFSFGLEDRVGKNHAALSFPHRAYVQNAAYQVMPSPPAGSWTFEAACAQGCAYNVGVYVS